MMCSLSSYMASSVLRSSLVASESLMACNSSARSLVTLSRRQFGAAAPSSGCLCRKPGRGSVFSKQMNRPRTLPWGLSWRMRGFTSHSSFASSSSSSSPSSPSSSPSSPAPSDARAAKIVGPTPPRPTTENISKTGLSDKPLELDVSVEEKIDWTRSFHGLSAEPFPKEVADILLAPMDPADVEIKPDGIVYLPEIKYRRILNRAFGPGAWGLVPRSESIVTPRAVTREYALVCNGRLVSVARGEQDYFSPDNIPTATEGCRSNALVRCCKDLGIASELWDPRWIRKYKAEHTREAWVEHVVNKKKAKIWVRKDDEVAYPWRETRQASVTKPPPA